VANQHTILKLVEHIQQQVVQLAETYAAEICCLLGRLAAAEEKAANDTTLLKEVSLRSVKRTVFVGLVKKCLYCHR